MQINDHLILVEMTTLQNNLSDLRKLFDDIASEFHDDRPGYLTGMTFCCNVVVELDVNDVFIKHTFLLVRL